MATTGEKAKQYYERAAEARADAEKMTDAQTKKTLLEVAAGYEQLAIRLAANDARRQK